MAIYTVVFAVIIKIKVQWPFAVFLLVAQLPWIFFASSVQMGAGSIIEHGNLVKKVYFPRVLLPLATVISNLINLGITLIILFFFLIFYKIHITAHILLLPLAITCLFMMTLGLTLIVSSLAVYFRDIFHILEVIILVLFWSVPIVYPITLLDQLPQKMLWFTKIYRLNPLVEVLEMFRYALLYNSMPNLNFFLYAFFWSVGLLVIGYFVFKKLEFAFAREI